MLDHYKDRPTSAFGAGQYSVKAVYKINNAAVNGYNRLRAEEAFSFCQLGETVFPEKLIISLLNVQSRRKHLEDIASTLSLIQIDILFIVS